MQLKIFSKKNKSFIQQAGFSLLEIIIVIALIGTLMGIVISRITSGTDNAKSGITDTKAYTLQSKLIQYQLQEGKFPTTEQGLQALTTNPGSPIAAEEDFQDGWGNPFDYKLTSKGPLISSNGKDGQSGNRNSLCYLNGKKTDCNSAQ